MQQRSEPGPPPRHATTEQLRADIDRGLTSDKVRYPDPAAAPLGTDEEAAGTPISPELIAQTRHRETTAARKHRLAPQRARSKWIMIGVIVLIAGFVVAWMSRDEPGERVFRSGTFEQQAVTPGDPIASLGGVP